MTTKIGMQFRAQAVQYEKIEKIQLAYRMIGPAVDDETNLPPTILFIHGWPLNSLTYEHVINHLSKEFTCIAIDLPGLGQTDWYEGLDLSPKGQAKLIQQFMSKRAVERYSIYGNDSGGMIARYLADMDCDRVTHLMLSNTEIPNERPPWIPLYKKCMHIPGFLPVMRRLLRIKYFVRSPMALGGAFSDKSHYQGEFNRDFIQPLLTSSVVFSNAMASFMAIFNWQQLDNLVMIHPKLSMPALFIWGQDDPTFPEQPAQKMVAQLPAVKHFHSVSGAKLFVHQEKPEEVSAYIRRFLLSTD